MSIKIAVHGVHNAFSLELCRKVKRATDIEVLSGLKDGDEIITGSYQIIRTIRNEAQVKVDNKAPLKVNA